jgi:hypothetical protein
MTSSDDDQVRGGFEPVDLPAPTPKGRPAAPSTAPRPAPAPATAPRPAPVPSRARTAAPREPEGPRWPVLGLGGCVIAWVGATTMVLIHAVPGLRELAQIPLALLGYGWLPVALLAVGIQGDSPRFRLRRTLTIHRWIIIGLSVAATILGIVWQVKRWL